MMACLLGRARDHVHVQIRVADDGHLCGGVGRGREDWSRYSPRLQILSLILPVLNSVYFRPLLFVLFNSFDVDLQA
jgi:hypothetical protein